jgi:hypothetical protein
VVPFAAVRRLRQESGVSLMSVIYGSDIFDIKFFDAKKAKAEDTYMQKRAGY